MRNPRKLLLKFFCVVLQYFHELGKQVKDLCESVAVKRMEMLRYLPTLPQNVGTGHWGKNSLEKAVGSSAEPEYPVS